MSRGNGGEAMFGSDEDRRRFLGLVAEVRAIGGMDFAAAAQGVRRFWKRAEEDVAMKRFARELSKRC